MRIFLGVDAGNTKTLAVAATEDGAIIGSGRSGCGDIYGASTPEEALANIDGAVDVALESAGVARGDVCAAGCSLAGADWPEDYEYLYAKLAERGFPERCAIVNDGLGALRAGTADNVGVAVVCGTGAATGARGVDGRSWHASFWQVAGGGAYRLGFAAIDAMLLAELGLAPSTVLTPRLLGHYGYDDVGKLLHDFSRRVDPMPRRADALAHLVLDAATEGDDVAREIVRSQAWDMGRIAVAAARKVGFDDSEFPLVLAGGVLRHESTVLADDIVETVRDAGLGAVPVRSVLEPVVGALLLGFDKAGVDSVDSQFRSNLLRSMPDQALFHTKLQGTKPPSWIDNP